MTEEDQKLAILKRILEIQEKSLLNQEKAISQQEISVQRQATYLRISRIFLIIFIPVVGYVLSVFARLPKPR